MEEILLRGRRWKQSAIIVRTSCAIPSSMVCPPDSSHVEARFIRDLPVGVVRILKDSGLLHPPAVG